LVLKDLNSGNLGTMERRLAVPRFEDGQVAHSSLILADVIERIPTRSVGSGPFVIGDTKVRPRVKEEFRRTDRLGVYLQIYNLGINQEINKPEATIEYIIFRGNQVVFNHKESTLQLEGAGQQITLAKFLPLSSFPPGKYKLMISVTDHTRQQTVKPSATFRVLP
jgi:hypothetical protein